MTTTLGSFHAVLTCTLGGLKVTSTKTSFNTHPTSPTVACYLALNDTIAVASSPPCKMSAIGGTTND